MRGLTLATLFVGLSLLDQPEGDNDLSLVILQVVVAIATMVCVVLGI